MPNGPPGPYLGPPRRDGQAVGSLVLGIFSLLCPGILGLFFGAAAVVLGVVSIRRIKADDQRYGSGLALAGAVLGGLGFLLASAFVIYTVFINPEFVTDLTDRLTPTTTTTTDR